MQKKKRMVNGYPTAGRKVCVAQWQINRWASSAVANPDNTLPEVFCSSLSILCSSKEGNKKNAGRGWVVVSWGWT